MICLLDLKHLRVGDPMVLDLVCGTKRVGFYKGIRKFINDWMLVYSEVCTNDTLERSFEDILANKTSDLNFCFYNIKLDDIESLKVLKG